MIQYHKKRIDEFKKAINASISTAFIVYEEIFMYEAFNSAFDLIVIKKN